MRSLSGYPSIDKPWLKYYSEEAINAQLPACTIYDYLYENNKDHLQDIALIYFKRKMTYGNLFQEIELVAKSLVGIGVKENDVCTIVSLSCVNSVILFYALNRIGAISNFVNVLASQEEIKGYIEESKSRYVMCLDLFLEKTLAGSSSDVEVISFSLSDYMPMQIRLAYDLKIGVGKFAALKDNRITPWKKFLELSNKVDELPVTTRRADSVGVWTHTGGTTGFPKTVLHTDKAYNAVAMQYKHCFGAKRGEVFLNIIVPFVVYGALTCLHMPLCLGVSVVLIPKFEADNWHTYFQTYRPNHIAGIPSYFIPMLSDSRLQNLNLSFVKSVSAGGDGLTEEIEKRINTFLSEHNSKAKLLRGYGMTEVGASAVTNFNSSSKVGSVGIPLPKNNVFVFNSERNCECIYGEANEICLQSPSLMKEYKDNENATKELLLVDSTGRKWIHTGDIGYVDEDGFVYIIGRMKRVMFVGPEGMAYKVFPQKIEDTISKIPEVLEVCVVSNQVETGFVPVAYLSLKADSSKAKEEVVKEVQIKCKQCLPDYMQPFDVRILDSLPKTSIGKVDFHLLECWEKSGSQAAEG